MNRLAQSSIFELLWPRSSKKLTFCCGRLVLQSRSLDRRVADQSSLLSLSFLLLLLFLVYHIRRTYSYLPYVSMQASHQLLCVPAASFSTIDAFRPTSSSSTFLLLYHSEPKR